MHFAWEIADDFVLTGIQGRRRFSSNRFIFQFVIWFILIVVSRRILDNNRIFDVINGKNVNCSRYINELKKIFKYLDGLF